MLASEGGDHDSIAQAARLATHYQRRAVIAVIRPAHGDHTTDVVRRLQATLPSTISVIFVSSTVEAIGLIASMRVRCCH